MLNAKQERFIQNIVKGMSQREAYKEAYQANYKDEAIDSKASALFNTDKVQKRYRELMSKLEEESIMSAKERMIWLSDVVKGKVTHISYDSNGNAYDNEAYISYNAQINGEDGDSTFIDILGENYTHIDNSDDLDINILLDESLNHIKSYLLFENSLNKLDIIDGRKVTNSEGMILAQKNEMEYIEVSAKTGSNVYLIFEKLAAQLVKKADKAENNPILSYKLMKKGDQYRETKTGCC